MLLIMLNTPSITQRSTKMNLNRVALFSPKFPLTASLSSSTSTGVRLILFSYCRPISIHHLRSGLQRRVSKIGIIIPKSSRIPPSREHIVDRQIRVGVLLDVYVVAVTFAPAGQAAHLGLSNVYNLRGISLMIVERQSTPLAWKRALWERS